ncbi:integrator complex subunit 11 [Dendrobium catenatum]|uniref:Integrator complex subunit 11 n=1 Tax=Dendrobium catenatum TaxID=906689 RepID=A0A2I0WXU1_9ASPA|nr:integrator complex subunit 11 [Dendrobium catenatum]
MDFLYAKHRARKNKNVIKEITTSHSHFSSPPEVASTIIAHFKDIFNAPKPILVDDIFILVGNLVPLNLHSPLLAPVTNEEIKKIVFTGKAASAPGPDGFSFDFYKHSWHFIGLQACNAVKSFFSIGYIPRGAKVTAITKIPKNSHAFDIPDFRLISLCNVFYKIVAKLFANKLKLSLPYIIHDS